MNSACGSILAQALPLVDIIFELIWMPTTVTKYEFPNCVFEVNIESFFEREVEEIGHDFLQLTNNQCQFTLGRSRAIEIVLLDIHFPSEDFAHTLLLWTHASCRYTPDIGPYSGPLRLSSSLLVAE